MRITKSDATNTSRQGIIETTRQAIEAVFGPPTEYAAGDKVTTQWAVRIDGVTATIYDYKRKAAPECYEMYAWHIGGRDKKAVEKVQEALGLMNEGAEAEVLKVALNIVRKYAKKDKDQELQECANVLDVLIGDLQDIDKLMVR